VKKTVIIILTFIGLANYANGQDCLNSIEQYYLSIDTTFRPVFKSVEKYPEILNNRDFLMKTGRQSQLFDSLQCCPVKVQIRFVVESDSTLTNIQVCTKMMFCDDEIIATETDKFNNRMTELLSNVKSIPGELNGKKVAVVCIVPIHFECNRR
jgi:hypothetical protein